MSRQYSVRELTARTNFDNEDKMWGFLKHLMKCRDYSSKGRKM